MSLLSSCTKLECKSCPFFDCLVRGSEPICFISKSLILSRYVSHGHHLDCPLLDGKEITIKSEDGMLIIRRDWD